MKLVMIEITEKDFKDFSSTHLSTKTIGTFNDVKSGNPQAVIKASELEDGTADKEKYTLIHLSTPSQEDDKYYKLVLVD